MKDIRFTLTDTNYTVQAQSRLNADGGCYADFCLMLRKIQEGLYSQSLAYLGIDGMDRQHKCLTITDRGQ